MLTIIIILPINNLIDKLNNGNIIGNLNEHTEEISACQFNFSGNNVLKAFINVLNL